MFFHQPGSYAFDVDHTLQVLRSRPPADFGSFPGRLGFSRRGLRKNTVSENRNLRSQLFKPRCKLILRMAPGHKVRAEQQQENARVVATTAAAAAVREGFATVIVVIVVVVIVVVVVVVVVIIISRV